MRKKEPTLQEKMRDLRCRIENVETKLSMIGEPLLMDALAYELLALRARLRFLIEEAKSSF